MVIEEAIRDFEASAERLRSFVHDRLVLESKAILTSLKDRSPFSTGQYRSGWFALDVSTSATPSVTFKNSTPYSGLMEEGAGVNDSPWYYPGIKQRASTGKLFIYRNRVYAGGLNPGESLAKGGAINSAVIENYNAQRLLVLAIADAVVKAI